MKREKDEASSFVECFLLCKARLASVVGRIAKPHEIEDIVKETFVQSFAASRSRSIRNPQAYMIRVARNIAYDNFNLPDNKAEALSIEFDENHFENFDNPEIRCIAEQKFLEFCKAVEMLPAACRRAFILKRVYGLSLGEISENLKISESTAEKHVAKGMYLVVKYLADGKATKSLDSPKGKKPREMR